MPAGYGPCLTGASLRPRLFRIMAWTLKMIPRRLLLLAAFLAAGPALAADGPAPRTLTDDGLLPSCNDPGALSHIASAFRIKESRFWNSNLQLVSFGEPVQVGYRSWGAEFLPRRFCRAPAEVSDGRVTQVHYAIVYKTGTLGIANAVEWCVQGYDRNLAFAPGCRMAGP